MKTPKTFHVSPSGRDTAPGTAARPFATPGRAIRAAREERRRTGRAARVVLAAGEYRLSRPLRLGPADSGLAVEAAPGARAVLTGRRPVTGWRREEGGLWSAPVPWVTDRDRSFRTLFAGGEARPRAVFPKNGDRFTAKPVVQEDGVDWETWAWKTMRTRVEIGKGEVDPAWDLRGGEAVFCHWWVDSHVEPLRVVEEGDRAFLELETPLRRCPHKALWRLENLPVFATEPGEWALDWRKRRVYYRPKKGEDMAKARVEVPFAERLLELRGAGDVSFRGISFSGSRFELPHGERNDFQGSFAVDAAVLLADARRCRFERCRFEDLGGWAVEMEDGTRDCAFSRSAFVRLGAGAVRLGCDPHSWRGGTPEDPMRDAAPPDPRIRVAGNEISDCEIGPYGLDFPSAPGVFLTDAEGTRIVHNHIHDGYYTGVSAGWVWGHLPSTSHGNEISFNHIHDIGKGLLADMGGVYTLGVSSGTCIRNNLVHDIDARGYGGWGLYNDEGSTGILIENNVVFRTTFAGYHMHYGRDCIVRNNVFGGGRADQIARSRRMAQISFFFYANVVYWTEGKLHTGDWDDKDDWELQFHPRLSRKLRKTVECDWNLYFNPKLKRSEARFGPDLTWEEWRSRGQDVHSLWADPKFADPAAGDFTLAADSPAFRLGFRPIDLSAVGPR